MHDLPTYYLLPLVGVNFKDFGTYHQGSNLISTKINIKTLKLICNVKNIRSIHQKVYETKQFSMEEGDNLIFNFPSNLPQTLNAFVKGKYSTIPRAIKKYLFENSGLPRNHDVLLALNKTASLRERLEDQIGEALPKDAELLSVPEEKWFT